MLVVISPHLDDAIFSCGDVIARAPEVRIVTICAGVPPADAEIGHFDEMAGFASPAEAVRTRRAEDAAAAVVIEAEVIHLGAIEDQYDRTPEHEGTVHEITRDAISYYTQAGDLILAPLGLRHPDHEHVAAEVHRTAGEIRMDLWRYEELPYRALWPEYVKPALRTAGLRRPDFIGDAATPAKLRALRCYGSQIVGMDTTKLILPERLYRCPGGTGLELP